MELSEQRLGTLASTKSGTRQFAFAPASIEQPDRLHSRFCKKPIASDFDEIWQYSRDESERSTAPAY